MAETPTVYVICDNNCKYESMTKEQILAAIIQAIENGSIGDCDTGFITTVKTINGISAQFFVGTQAEYDALSEELKQNLFKIITNDTTKEGIENSINAILERLVTAETNIYALSADKKNYRGNGTGFVYPNSYKNVNDIKTEGHYFLINATGTLPPGASHGFLDVSYFDGDGFAPSGRGAEPLTKQTWRNWLDEKQWTRTFHHNNASPYWTAWKQTAGEGTTVTKAINALSFTVDSTNKTVTAPIGSLLTLALENDEYNTYALSYKAGHTITETIYTGNSSNGVDEFQHLTKYSETDHTLKGSWQIVGYCGKDAEGLRFYLIRRIA